MVEKLWRGGGQEVAHSRESEPPPDVTLRERDERHAHRV
ncbi:hypothetical protein SUDANB108_06571 [Streptomyces sp. enrichment culture]